LEKEAEGEGKSGKAHGKKNRGELLGERLWAGVRKGGGKGKGNDRKGKEVHLLLLAICSPIEEVGDGK